jgi:pyrroline-5-carboxylate reductase
MKLGFLGCGKMSGALVRGILSGGVCGAADVRVSDVVPAAVEALGRETGVRCEASNEAVVAGSDVVVVCVKPQDALGVLRSLGGVLAGRLVVSIAAGLSLARLEEAAGAGVRVVRVMPNTPALVHKGASVYALGTAATEADAQTVEKLFGAVGSVGCVKEPLLDAVTGLSGSGPAYAYLMVEALADGGVLMGLPRELALRLAAQTVAGAAEMILQTGQHPGTLRDAVTSPGGTTIAGLEALERGGVRAGLIAAVRAATERSRELGRG